MKVKVLEHSIRNLIANIKIYKMTLHMFVLAFAISEIFQIVA